MKNKLRSPFFYVGDKYKIMPQLIELFPDSMFKEKLGIYPYNINDFIVKLNSSNSLLDMEYLILDLEKTI